MATPENPSFVALQTELADVRKRLEIADENENAIERFFKRERLLELQDELQDEIEASSSPYKHG